MARLWFIQNGKTKMSLVGMTRNEYGTDVSKHKCDTCGTDYTICPAVKEGTKLFDNCMVEPCGSYDVNSDIDLLFMTDEEIAREKKIVPINLKAKRAALQRELINK